MTPGRGGKGKATQPTAAKNKAAAQQNGAAALNVQPTQSTQFQAQFIQTNILPPEVLRQFDDLVPGAAARLLELAHEETLMRRKQEQLALDANIEAQKRQIGIAEYQSKAVFRSDIVGQAFGFLICLACVAGAVYLGVSGAPWQVSTALAAIPTAAIIQAFRMVPKGHRQKQEPKPDKQE